MSSRSKTTSTAISSLDSQLVKIATNRAAEKRNLEEHEEQLQANLKEINEKGGPGKSTWPPRTGSKVSAAAFVPSLSQGSNMDDLMEIDEPKGTPMSPQGDSKAKKAFK